MKDSIKRWLDGKDLIKYAWPGGYPVMYLDGQGSTLCPDCATDSLYDEVFDKYKPITGFPIMEGPNVFCDDCGKDFETAYGDPEAEQFRRKEEESRARAYK